MTSMLPAILLLLLLLMNRRGGIAIVEVVRLGEMNNRRGAEGCLERVVRLEEAGARVVSLGAQTLEATVVMTMTGESKKCRNEWRVGMSTVKSGVKRGTRSEERNETTNTKGNKRRRVRVRALLGVVF